MTINPREIQEEYREQVNLFLTCYPKIGQQLAERYLALVTSSEYRTSSGYQNRKERVNGET